MTNLDKAILRAQSRYNSRYATAQKYYNAGKLSYDEYTRALAKCVSRRSDESEAAFAADEAERGTTTSATKAQVN